MIKSGDHLNSSSTFVYLLARTTSSTVFGVCLRSDGLYTNVAYGVVETPLRDNNLENATNNLRYFSSELPSVWYNKYPWMINFESNIPANHPNE